MWDELHRRLLTKGNLSRAREWLATINPQDRPVQTMIVAATFASVEAVDLLCEHGWTMTSPADSGFTPLMAAAEVGRTDMIDHLIKAGVDLDAQDAHGLTALMYAARHQYAETVAMLLRGGASADPIDKAGWSAADHARWRNVGIRLGSVELNTRVPTLRRTEARRVLETQER